ncbi:hypothetical protein Celaphus_00019336 [Cervus elaphus hippelaphus]|uniref:Uncharacterized protein n=1 Tax=Cervus elaphus hippelaphus TaxID=46360 RepID=A0A212C2R8_CEREH|nr:hypothetical protein Celaphus_00019336 [Cervus elaphus hippelaphus]
MTQHLKVKILSHHMVSHCKLEIIQEEILLPKVDFTIDGLLIDVESKGEKSGQVSYPETNRPNPSGKNYFSVSNTTIPPVVLILKNMESFTTKGLRAFTIISSQH